MSSASSDDSTRSGTATRPGTAGRPGTATPTPNLGVLLREPFLALVDHVQRRLGEAGHADLRASHGNVFQFLDEGGTRVGVLAARARMTKQSMAELVLHLEAHGYVERVSDPADRRAKLVRTTARGREAIGVARVAIAEMEARWAACLGEHELERLRRLLARLGGSVSAR